MTLLRIDPRANMGYPINYPCNAQVFVGYPSLTNTFQDGLSNAIILAEHYYRCGGDRYFYVRNNPSHRSGSHRPTFADGDSILKGVNEGDVYPITDLVTHVTRPSRPGAMFQVTPKVWYLEDANIRREPRGNECDWSVPQTPHPAGMVVGLADGSVRTLRGSMSPELFWGAVTPAGGEVLSDW